MSDVPLPEELVGLLAVRRGHYRLESGHHGDLWLDLDTLFLRPSLIRPLARELAKKLSAHQIEAVCGPRSEEHTSELQSRRDLVCRLLLEKKKSQLTWNKEPIVRVSKNMK